MSDVEVGSYRYDVFTESWTVVAPARQRVQVVGRARDVLPGLDGACAFCPGNEPLTGDAVHVLRGPDGAWEVRVVKNIFPAVGAESDDMILIEGGRARPAEGAQEVVIECPEHVMDLVDMPLPRIARLLGVYRDRLRVLSQQEGVAEVALFRNRGRRAGSSQPHPHAQLVATAVPGREQATRWRIACAHHEACGETLLATHLREQLALGTRVVERGSGFVAMTPFAPHGPYALWLMPSGPSPCFRAVEDDALTELASLLQRTLRAVIEVSHRSAYNLVFRLPPADALANGAAFWLLEVRPRGGGPAGLELTSGLDIVAVSPERCAREVRAVLWSR